MKFKKGQKVFTVGLRANTFFPEIREVTLVRRPTHRERTSNDTCWYVSGMYDAVDGVSDIPEERLHHIREAAATELRSQCLGRIKEYVNILIENQ